MTAFQLLERSESDLLQQLLLGASVIPHQVWFPILAMDSWLDLDGQAQLMICAQDYINTPGIGINLYPHLPYLAQDKVNYKANNDGKFWRPDHIWEVYIMKIHMTPTCTALVDLGEKPSNICKRL